MRRNIILDLCGGSGSWSQPYEDAGYDVRLVTLPDTNVITYVPPNSVYGILAAPPCTEFSIVKDHKLERFFETGMNTINACLRIIFTCKPKFWVLENPIGFLSNYLGNPVKTFQPWEYGDPWTKRTALWGDFNMPDTTYKAWEDVPKIDSLYIRPGRQKPSIAFLHKSACKDIPQLSHYDPKTDADFRSITPPGFAKEFFKHNQ